MGVPGLWRIIDLASQPLDLEKCSGLRIAIDINSHANRLVHSTSASNWIYILARDLFRILHFNIRIVVVLMGRRPLEKIYSTALGDESQDTSYYRVRSLILRSNKDSPKRSSQTETKQSVDEPIIIPTTKTQPRKMILANLEDAESINDVSQRQINSVSKITALPSTQLIHHSNHSGSYIFYENNQPKIQLPSEENDKTPKILHIPTPQDQLSNSFNSSFFDDIKDIISEDDPSSDGIQPPEDRDQQLQPKDLLPISLLPDDNSYLPPIENYLTATHIRLIEKLCTVLGIPFIQAPEEACAECARLEREKIVDAVATEDNNVVLFGSKLMIRGIFTRPQIITIETIEKVGLTRERLLMIAMMIDGDYNMDIKKRLFTVGPVRGMEILSLFPDEKEGLFQFKKWWIRVVRNKEKENNPILRRLAKMKWLKKLIMPEKFPPIELLTAFKNPVVLDEKLVVKFPKFKPEEVISFIRQSSSFNEERIKEITLNFAHRVEPFQSNKVPDNYKLTKFAYKPNNLNVSSTFQSFIDRLIQYDKAHKKSQKGKNEEEDDNDEWDTVSDDGSGSDNQDEKQSNNDNTNEEEEEEEDQDSIAEDD